MLRTGDEWRMSEIPEKSRDIIDALEIPVMQKSGSQSLNHNQVTGTLSNRL